MKKDKLYLDASIVGKVSYFSLSRLTAWYRIVMPELPEVETVRRGLESLIVGRKL